MQLTMCAYQSEEDYWRIRAFLREVFLLNDRRELCWQVARLDYWRWHVIENCNACGPVQDVTFIWETPEGQIAAVLHPEGRGEAHLQTHPGLRTPELLEAMIVAAEQRLADVNSDGGHALRVLADCRDTLCHDILIRRGYIKRGWAEHQWRRELGAPIPDVLVAPGYSVRSLGDVDELPARSWASWRAFHPNEPDERYEGWTWYHNIQRMPLYRRDLDLVAVAPTGEIASFCTIWYDDVTRGAYYEPVGTVPEHQRRGLAKALLTEGLRRLKRMGATRAFVGGYEPGPNALYTSVMGADHDLSEPWVKEW
jgi:GNAT superfamily N-acetyltransferase